VSTPRRAKASLLEPKGHADDPGAARRARLGIDRLDRAHALAGQVDGLALVCGRGGPDRVERERVGLVAPAAAAAERQGGDDRRRD
jgi:hypothetical protein